MHDASWAAMDRGLRLRVVWWRPCTQQSWSTGQVGVRSQGSGVAAWTVNGERAHDFRAIGVASRTLHVGGRSGCSWERK